MPRDEGLHRIGRENPCGRSVRLLCILLIAGCSSLQQDRVFVDMDRVVAAERAPDLSIKPLPQPHVAAAAVDFNQQGLPALTSADRTLKHLQDAKRLIEQNRGKSIEALSTMLKQIYLARAEDEIANRTREGQPAQEAILAAALER